MKKISIKDVIEFRRKSDRSKHNFAINLKSEKEKINSEGGGDYWITSISAISNSYKQDDVQLIIDKRSELEEKHEATDFKTTKTMYKRNIDILHSSEEFDFDKWKPSKAMKFEKKYKDYSILDIEGLQIQVSPTHIFTFKNGSVEEIGAIWFVAKLDGYRRDELGMFTDILYRYLTIHFSKKYVINPQYCIAVDISNGADVNYLQLRQGDIPLILDSIVDEIKKLMR